MGAPKDNQNAIGNKGGNPGYGALSFVKERVQKFCPNWWNKWEHIMNNGDKDEVKFAMAEFNKLQVKLMPTTLANDDEKPLIIKFDDGVLKATQQAERDNNESV
jgi:hypothetical protein